MGRVPESQRWLTRARTSSAPDGICSPHMRSRSAMSRHANPLSRRSLSAVIALGSGGGPTRDEGNDADHARAPVVAPKGNVSVVNGRLPNRRSGCQSDLAARCARMLNRPRCEMDLKRTAHAVADLRQLRWPRGMEAPIRRGAGGRLGHLTGTGFPAGCVLALWGCALDIRLRTQSELVPNMRRMPTSWPQRLWLIRHGQSAGNVARDAAEAGGLAVIDLSWRDIDVPLSELGALQSSALGDWFGALRPEERPEVILCSPYMRAQETARLIAEAAGLQDPSVRLRLDERLREKEFGILDRLTKFGIQQKHPDLNEQRLHVGKFYFRPPGGESWCDVILRLRSLLEMITREYADRRVLVVAHQVIVNCMRYLLEHMDERAILDIDRQGDVPNCSVTSYRAARHEDEDQVLQLELVNFVAPLREAAAPVTSAPDVPAAPKP